MAIDHSSAYHRRQERRNNSSDAIKTRRPESQKRYGHYTPFSFRVTPVLWIAGILIGIGLSASVAIHLSHKLGQGVSQSSMHSLTRSKFVKKATVNTGMSVGKRLPPKVKPQFSFYTMLPKYRAVATPLKQQSAPLAANNGEGPASKFYVQIAAFNRKALAERLMKRLRKSGINAGLKAIVSDSGPNMYKVRIGPESKARVNNTLARISTLKLNGLVMRATG